MKIFTFTILSLFVATTLFGQTPTAYYTFTGNANDESGNENHGVINGATLTTDRYGNADEAYYFDGVDDYIEVAHDAMVSTGGMTSFTVMLWARWDDIDVRQRFITKGYAGDPEDLEYEIGVLADNTVDAGWEAYGGADQKIISTQTITDQEWHLYTMTFDGTNHITYLDNAIIAEANNAFAPGAGSSREMLIGALLSLGEYIYVFKGAIDEVRIYHTTLSAHNIDSIYNAEEPNAVELNTVKTEGGLIHYPNPTNGLVNFEMTNNQDAAYELIITNFEGKILSRKSSYANNATIDLSQFATGMYFVKVIQSSNTSVFKIIKE